MYKAKCIYSTKLELVFGPQIAHKYGHVTVGFKRRHVLHRPAIGPPSAVQETLVVVDHSKYEANITQSAIKTSLDGDKRKDIKCFKRKRDGQEERAKN